MRNIRLGVIGVGRWGVNVVREFQRLPGVEIAWIFDKDPDLAKTLSQKYNIPSIEQLELKTDSTNAVAICTPASTHAPIAMKALRAGKHVFVEKPLALTESSAQELTDFAREKGLVLSTGLIFLFHPVIHWLQQAIRSGLFGTVLEISSTRINRGPERNDVNVLWDLVSHDVSVLVYLFGNELKLLRGSLHGPNAAGQLGTAHLDLATNFGAQISILASWSGLKKIRLLELIGEENSLTYDGMSPHQGLRVWNIRSGHPVTVPSFDTAPPLQRELETFANTLLGGRQDSTVDIISLDVVRHIEAWEHQINI